MTRAVVRDHVVAALSQLGAAGSPGSASVTFLGTDPLEVLRLGPTPQGTVYYASLGCSDHPMTDPADIAAHPLRGPRAEVVLALRGPTPAGLARSIAVLAAAPAVEGLVLVADALVDLGTPLWAGAAFTAVLLSDSDLDECPLAAPRSPVRFLQATPITATEAAWVRLKGAPALREAWLSDGVDVLDPARPASRPA